MIMLSADKEAKKTYSPQLQIDCKIYTTNWQYLLRVLGKSCSTNLPNHL